MEKEINKHLETMEALEDQIDTDIDSIMSKIDIQSIIDDPEAELEAVTAALMVALEEKYDDAIKSGRKLAGAFDGD